MRRYILVGVAVLVLTGCTGEANAVETQSQSDQQGIYNQSQPIHQHPYSNYRQSLIQIQDQLATGDVTTWTVWESYSGVPEGMCKSMGYPIPVTTQLSNPQQAVNSPNGASGGVAVGQMDPTGVYTAPSGLGTWVLCLDNAGVAHPSYIEGVTNAFPYEVAIQDGKVIQVGQPDQKSAIKPCDPVTKKC